MSENGTLNGTRVSKKQLLGDPHKNPPKVYPAYDCLPPRLRDSRQWIAWKWSWNAKRSQWDKPPFSVITGSMDEWQTEASLGSIVQAAECIRQKDASGIGFVMQKAKDGLYLVAIDLDDVVNAETGEIIDWPEPYPKKWKSPLQPKKIMALLGGYWELSPSGTGLRGFVICRGVDFGRLGNKGGAEFYVENKYLTVTGRRIDPISGELANGPCEVQEVDATILNSVMAEFGDSKEEQAEKVQKAKKKRSRLVTNDDFVPTAEDVLEAARSASNAAKFAKLWEGDISDYGDNSTADSALCCLIAFYAGANEELIDQIFRQSQLLRDKWDEIHDGGGRTYGQMTVANSLSVVKEFYRWTPAPCVTNIGTKVVADKDGEERKVSYPLSITEIIEAVQGFTGDWPRRVSDQLFAEENKALHWLSSVDALFGYLHGVVGKVAWHDGASLVRRKEFFSRLTQTATSYTAIEEFPHFPPFPNHYYSHRDIVPGDGSALKGLVDRYTPATPIDRDLIYAYFATLFWGGPYGARPAFVFTSKDGRGVGKTKIAEHGGRLTCGVFDFSSGEETATIKKRLLTPTAATKRICLIDNIKTSKFSWAEAEAMLTSSSISGHQLYAGERDRPNSLLWSLTMNGPGMSRDYAQRSVILQLARPVYSDNWEENANLYIDLNRWQIIADVAAFFQQPAQKLTKCSRWGLWERDILARLPDPVEAQHVLAERQAEVDVDADEAGEVEDYFSQELQRNGYDPAADWVHIPNDVALAWMQTATNQRFTTTGMKRMVNQWANEGMAERLCENPCRANGRGLLWRGSPGNRTTKVSYVLRDRIAGYSNAGNVNGNQF